MTSQNGLMSTDAPKFSTTYDPGCGQFAPGQRSDQTDPLRLLFYLLINIIFIPTYTWHI
ncbi:hypothetical protein PILCRDRAFT_825673 [Piloderma croceum F 1598]|uniref:Uncharacterized protein n=1 Tax=Piloderma croceum (strain F 1598) TaxID=765440 RepID=A0A0C3AT87_PILCF|nr:hypothetical protein PILCRDRAFT_825673 [Piloderma croceum F 1598]